MDGATEGAERGGEGRWIVAAMCVGQVAFLYCWIKFFDIISLNYRSC